AERTDDVEALDVGFVLRADGRNRGRIPVWKRHSAGLDESARGRRAEARDDAIKDDLRASIGGVEDHPAGLASGAEGIDLFRRRVVVALDHAIVDRLEDGGFVALLGAAEFVLAVD